MINLSNYRLSRFAITTHDQYGNLLATHAVSNRFYRIHCPSSLQNVCPELTMDLISQMQPSDIEQMIEGRIITDQDEFSDDTINDLYETAVTHNKRLDIVILTTNQCNFSCVYCFQKRETYTLNFKQYDALILFIENKIKQYNYRDVKIRWFGGEPLLGLQGIQYFSEKLNELKKKYKFTYGCGIITNGYLLDLKTFQELYRYHVVTYQISIDGLPDIKQRVLKNGESSFERIFYHLKQIKENVKYQMFSITIRINFTRELIERADEIVDLFYRNFGDDRRFCFSFIPVFDWSYKDSDFLKAEQLKKELVHEKDVADIMKKYSGQLDFKAWTNLLFAHNDCWAGTRHGYTIDANGDILKCDFKLEGFEDNRVGHIDPDGNLTFDPEKEKKWIFDAPLPECYDCACFPLCLSTSCGAARIQGIMKHKCVSFQQRVLDYLEIESYNSRNKFWEVSI